LIESGIRIHGTEYDWPKNMAPSGFSMKVNHTSVHKHDKSDILNKSGVNISIA
jgi:hypothetical protein